MATQRVQIGVSFMTPETVYVASSSGGSATTSLSVYVPVVGAPITILDRNTGNPPTVYTTETGSSTASSLATDTGGLVDGWVVEGSYTVTAGSVGGFSGASIAWEAVRGDGVENIYSGAVVSSSLASAVQQLLVPTGVILDFGGATAPTGYVFCDGSVYATGAVGTTYHNLSTTLNGAWNTGSEGTGNFRVPDLRSLVTVGVGQGTGLSSRVLGPRSKQSANAGVVGGEEIHTLANNEMPQHSHGGATGGGTTGVDAPDHSHTSVTYGREDFMAGAGGTWYSATAWGTGFQAFSTTGANVRHAHSVPALAINNDGGSQSHNNMQPYAGTNKIIKL